jgi:hypothetical protein
MRKLAERLTCTALKEVLGKMAFGSIFLPRLARLLVSVHVRFWVYDGSMQWWFNEMLMLLELCEFCCAGTARPSGPDLRWRGFGWVTFGAEGVKGPKTPRVWCALAQGPRRSGRDVLEAWCDRRGVVNCFGADGAAWRLVSAPSRGLRNTCLQRTCKGAPYEAETRGTACKGGSAVRRHAGGLYDAGSYSYTLVKCLKPFVRNGKGVIEVDNYA